MNTITVKDDFDLYKITYSGQCFRACELDDGWYRFVTGHNVLLIRKACSTDNSCTGNSSGGTVYEISCSLSEWNDVWHHYFDMDTDYSAIRRMVSPSDKYMHSAAEVGCGIRILNQDPFEMLISFIISQRKSIPAIRSSVEKICNKWGSNVSVSTETGTVNIKTFPEAPVLSGLNADDLADCGLGYRVPYILDAIARVNDGRLNLGECISLSDEELFEALKSVYGVGDKVANCVSLFAFHRTGRAPVDTWIAKVINEEYNGINPFPKYGPRAGIMQQYVFYRCVNGDGSL